MGEKKVSVITDGAGVYDFADLTDGVWKLHVEMLCFEPVDKEIAVAANAPAAEWELKLLPFEQIKASAPPPPPSATPAAATPTAPTPAATSSAAPPAETKPSIVA